MSRLFGQTKTKLSVPTIAIRTIYGTFREEDRCINATDDGYALDALLEKWLGLLAKKEFRPHNPMTNLGNYLLWNKTYDFICIWNKKPTTSPSQPTAKKHEPNTEV